MNSPSGQRGKRAKIKLGEIFPVCMISFYDLGTRERVPARFNSDATCIVTDVIMGMLQNIPLGTAAETGLPKVKKEGGMEKDPKRLPTITITYAFEERYKRHKGRRGGLINTTIVYNTLYIIMWIVFFYCSECFLKIPRAYLQKNNANSVFFIG